jgi:hypothetical protein
MPDTVTISNPFGRQSVRVPVNGVSRSWAVDRAGTLSGEVTNETLHRFSLNGPLIGSWIEVDHDDAGYWGGEISDVQPNGDGTTEIAAEDWGALFAARLLPDTGVEISGSAGVLARRIITEATSQATTAIKTFIIDDQGPQCAVRMDGSDLRGALDSLAMASGQSWWIDPESRVFYWGYRGRDRSGAVQLCAPRHIVGYRPRRSIAPMVNSLSAYPLNALNPQLQTIVVEDPASIAAVGLRQKKVAIGSGITATAIRPAAQSTVAALAQLGQSISMDVANLDQCWTWFTEGDTICCLFPDDSARAVVRVLARVVDNGTSVMNVAGVVTEWTVLS